MELKILNQSLGNKGCTILKYLRTFSQNICFKTEIIFIIQRVSAICLKANKLNNSNSFLDWSQTSQNETSEYITSCITTFCLDKSLVVPVVLRHLTPEWVSLIGLVTIAASVMSSIDSSFLAASSMFAHNVHKMVFRPMVSLVRS